MLADNSKVYVSKDRFGGAGTFARVPIKKGEIIEYGLTRRLPVDGHECPYVFTWSFERDVWATLSGCGILYNSTIDGTDNSVVKPYYDEDRFEIIALRDIEAGEELTHFYESIPWRRCFSDLKELREQNCNGEVCPSPLADQLGRYSLLRKKEAGVDVEEPVPEVVPENDVKVVEALDVETFVDNSKVCLRKDQYGGAGVFAVEAIKKGERIEKGVARRLLAEGHKSKSVLSWGENLDGTKVWAIASGYGLFYNTSFDGEVNAEMKRDLKEDTFEVYAIADIEKDQEITYLYRSLEWRECFQELKDKRDNCKFAGA